MTEISIPPRRPDKSRLRPSVDQLSINSSIYSISPSTSPISDNEQARFSPTPSINAMLQTKPEKSKYRSRFTEHFEGKKEQQEEEEDTSISTRPETLMASKSLTSFTSIASSPAVMKHRSTEDQLNLPLDHRMTTSTTTTPKRIQLTSSVSTPSHIPKDIKPRKFGSSESVHNSLNSSSSKINALLPTMSMNRADVIITRLENWSDFLKSILNWMEEVSKINLASSRHYYQRAYPFLEESVAITTTTTQDAFNATLVQESINGSILTVQAGFQVLTMQIAAEQQEFAKTLDRDYLPNLVKLRKECKDRIHKLKHDPALLMEELLRRAEVTRSKMTHLNRCCKQADKLQGQVEMDPWVANLLVLRQLKREVDEENRLRLLMVNIQKEAQAFEKRLIETIKPTIQYCYQRLAPGSLDGTDDTETAPFQLLLDQVMPSYEWSQFAELRKKDLVNESNPTKDYLKINYPNKFHPLVMTLLKGKLQRKVGVRKQFTERNYVLSQGGYLHQFTLDDKVSPEKTFYIPACTIVPSIDLSQLSNPDQKSVLENTLLDNSNTFEVCRPASNVLQRDKVSVFRAANREELITWCRLLVHISSGVSLSSLGVTDHDVLFLPNAGNQSFDDLENRPSSSLVSRTNSSTRQKSISGVEKSSDKGNTPTSSPARSIHSVRTEESFNEPAAMTKRRSALLANLNSQKASLFTEDENKTPTKVPKEYLKMIEEDKQNNTDAESFVTATHPTDTHSTEDSEKEREDMDDFFPVPDEDDAISIQTVSTAKGPVSDSPDKSPSIVSAITFDDAQSSLYFSSASAPPSPSVSNRSSIISIPEFEFIPQNTPSTQEGSARLSAAQMYKAALSVDMDQKD